MGCYGIERRETMSNKTQLQANNETLASILSNVLGLPSQESLKHGAYVWKKLTKSIVVKFVQTSYNPIKFTVSSGDIDLGSVDESWFVGIKCSYSWATAVYAFEFMENNVFVIWTADGKSHLYEGTYSYNPSNKTLTTDINPSGSFGINSSATKQGNFLDYIVSDSPTAYPDGAVHTDGYWYEKVVEGIPSPAGFTKVTVDTFTPTSNQRLDTTTIEHSHGSIPTLCVVIGNPLTTSNVPFQVGAINGSKKYGIMLGEGTGYWMSGAVLTANNFRFHETYGFNFIAGVEYTVICMS